MRIFLLGFMGSGKTHSGARLAQALQYQFLDLDDWIEEKAGKSISEIFRLESETGFRKREQEALFAMTQFENVVVATGGGAPCFFNNMEWMKRHGITIYLRAPISLLAERLRQGMSHRPLLSGLSPTQLEEYIKEKLSSREKVYQQAKVIYFQTPLEDDITSNLKKIVEICESRAKSEW